MGNWGGGGVSDEEMSARSDRVEYVLVSRGLESLPQRVYDEIEASGDFETIFDRDAVVLLRRLDCGPTGR